VPTLRAEHETAVPVIGISGSRRRAGKGVRRSSRVRSARVARSITGRLRVPTISYGAGVHCDGQGIVSADMLGPFEQFTPRFAKHYVDLATQISGAFKSYGEEVVAGQFPDDKPSYGINAVKLEKLEAEVRRP